MRNFVLPCLAVLLSACPSPAEEKKTDQELIQGDWAVVKAEQEGKDPVEFEKGLAPFVTYKGNKYTFKGVGLMTEAGEFKLDPKAKIPTLDYTITDGDHKGKKQLGIYKLEGDTLTICLAQEGADKRPASFKTSAKAAEYVMFVLKRKK